MTRTRSNRSRPTAGRMTHRPASALLAAAVATALIAGLTSCAAGPSTSSATPNASTSAVSASAAQSAAARALGTGSGTEVFAAHSPDVTASARAASVAIGALWRNVTGWRSACASTSTIETYLTAAQRALAKGHLSSARVLLAISLAELHGRLGRHLVSADHYAAYAAEIHRIIKEIPRHGQVTTTRGFPVPPVVLRCAAVSPAAAPSAPSLSLLLAATTGTDFASTPSVEESIHGAVAVGIGAIPDIVGVVAPEVELPEVTTDLVGTLAELLWPKTDPDNVTWDGMTTYVQNEIDKAVTQISDVIKADQLATMNDDLTALHAAIDRYSRDMSLLTPSATAFGGVADSDRTRAYSDWLALDTDFTNLLPHFTNDPSSFRNLPETINLYTLYLTTLRGWVLAPDVFNNSAQQAASWKADREAELVQAITKANAVVAEQMPKLEADQPTGTGSPLAVGWNHHWAFMDAMYAAGYNQVYYWDAMNPANFPPNAKTGAIAVPPDTTVVATPCYGAYTVPQASGANADAQLPVNADPSDLLGSTLLAPTTGSRPLVGLSIAGEMGQIDGIRSTYRGQAQGPFSGFAWRYPVTTPPYGAVLTFGPTTTNGWVTSVSGNYWAESVGTAANSSSGTSMVTVGGMTSARFTTTVTNAAGVATSTTGPLIPSTNEENASYYAGFPGYVLAWAGFASNPIGHPVLAGGGLFENGWGDSCLAFGFRLQSSY